MNMQQRPYQDKDDLNAMRQLLVIGTQSGVPASYTHPGSIDWDVFCPPDEDANRRNLRLWEEAEAGGAALRAWAIYSRHEGTFDVFIHPDIYGTPAHEAVMDEYVEWATARAQEVGASTLSPFWMFEYDMVTDRLLRARGFEKIAADPPPPLFERELDDLPEIQLPEGFSVQGVGNQADGRLRASVTHAAFHSRADSEAAFLSYARFMQSAVYDGERDLFVRSPDGRGAAACTIWFDNVNQIGLFEPVATHPDFQRQGLGKAVMIEGMRRMKAAGMRRASLGFDPTNAAALALYSSLGFRATAYFATYQKEV